MMLSGHEVSIMLFIIIFFMEYKDARRHCADIHDGCIKIGKSRPVSRCYRKHVAGQCCKTCKTLQRRETPECLYGDKQDWCKNIGKEYSLSKCYEKESVCCESCPSLKTNIAGCDYGDRILWCKHIGEYYDKSQCKGRENSSCCQTCHLWKDTFFQKELDLHDKKSNISITYEKISQNTQTVGSLVSSALHMDVNDFSSNNNYSSLIKPDISLISTTPIMLTNSVSTLIINGSIHSQNDEQLLEVHKTQSSSLNKEQNNSENVNSSLSIYSNNLYKSRDDVSNFIDFDSYDSTKYTLHDKDDKDKKHHSLHNIPYYTSDDEDLMSYGSGIRAIERDPVLYNYRTIDGKKVGDIRIAPDDSYEFLHHSGSNQLAKNVNKILLLFIFSNIVLMFT